MFNDAKKIERMVASRLGMSGNMSPVCGYAVMRANRSDKRVPTTYLKLKYHII